jgi:hypothetical protein
MNRTGRTLILAGLVLVLLMVSFGDHFPQYSILDMSVAGLSRAPGISYASSLDLFTVFGLVLVGALYWVAITRRI